MDLVAIVLAIIAVVIQRAKRGMTSSSQIDKAV
jgi:hypothetical protein